MIMYVIMIDKSIAEIDEKNFELYKRGMDFQDTDGCLIRWLAVETVYRETDCAKVGYARVGTSTVC